MDKERPPLTIVTAREDLAAPGPRGIPYDEFLTSQGVTPYNPPFHRHEPPPLPRFRFRRYKVGMREDPDGDRAYGVTFGTSAYSIRGRMVRRPHLLLEWGEWEVTIGWSL